ncbi:Crp/Fnr family transcriptional regulator [Ottowia testudinis]|uniref:Crp/Fnr family transcriptional regulator n=1 Tax=Ottowia testudinis TaxID=2816950 RepID=A0A975CHE5_9BURK|nr:cyclic nucleotide-binding domain-containing protein [Ottowia testudinis]QTD45131.1 Crp/Fnr family transcriptional regulator [Ottowia testudinis]
MMSSSPALACADVITPAAPQAQWGLGLAAGDTLLHAGHAGPVWRVSEGLLCVQRLVGEQAVVIQMAGPGDLVGLAALDAEPYACTVAALTPCRVHPLALDSEAARVQTLTAALHQQQRQALDITRLRTGPVRERMLWLLALLEQATGCAPGALARRALPVLKDMAQVVDSAPETVCRELKRLMPKAAPQRTRRRAARHHAATAAALAA